MTPKKGLVLADTSDLTKSDERIEHIKDALKNNSLIGLNVEATSRCNLSCTFCGMHGRRLPPASTSRPPRNLKRKMHMDVGLFQETVTKCRGLEKLKVLYLHGHGEPLLHPHIVEMVNFARAAGIAEQIVLITNGVLAKTSLFRDLVEAGMTGLRVSLDAITPDRYREIKGADFGKRVVANIDACLDLIRRGEISSSVSFTIECMRSNVEESRFSDETAKIVDYYGEKIKNLPHVAIRLREQFSWMELIDRSTGGGLYRRSVPCEQAFYMLLVHSDGDISMCCADSAKELVIGHIRQIHHMKDVVTSRALGVMRKGLLEQDYRLIPGCVHCDVHNAVDPLLLRERDSLLPLLSGKDDDRLNVPNRTGQPHRLHEGGR
ncbi:MAG: radical SAM protein [Syntrophorhabdales bacterium]|jgi:MoaA/NifB/PqqE/SkfB family radical SAM enzyme